MMDCVLDPESMKQKKKKKKKKIKNKKINKLENIHVT